MNGVDMPKEDRGMRDSQERRTTFMQKCMRKFEKRVREGRSRMPWKTFSLKHLSKRLRGEQLELWFSILDKDTQNLLEECVDVANFAWFIYENACIKEIAEQREVPNDIQ